VARAGRAAALDDDDSGRDVSALDELLDGLVDYAGLFPPAALGMREAVANYARYRTGERSEMLARFVLPVARLGEFVDAASVIPPDALGVWKLAVLAGATDAATLDAFNGKYGARWTIDVIEAKATSSADVASLAAALAPRYTVYVEIPVKDDPSLLLTAIAGADLRAKIRTGGVTADAFPAPSDVVRFIALCARVGLPFKATAGLHHPLRGEFPLTYAADSARGTMYGFLNVFLAAALLHAGKRESEVAPLLDERDARAIVVDDDGIAWRGHRVSRAAIRTARRTFAGSFGSCSFEEPVADLESLKKDLLPALR
jgi:hypothetical protein